MECAEEVLIDEGPPSSTTSLHKAYVDDNQKPVVGMAFDTIEEGWKFYNDYAKIVGFSVRNHTTNYKEKLLISKAFVCHKQGSRVQNDKKKKYCLFWRS